MPQASEAKTKLISVQSFNVCFPCHSFSGHQRAGLRQDTGDWSQGQKLSDGGHGARGVLDLGAGTFRVRASFMDEKLSFKS